MTVLMAALFWAITTISSYSADNPAPACPDTPMQRCVSGRLPAGPYVYLRFREACDGGETCGYWDVNLTVSALPR